MSEMNTYKTENGDLTFIERDDCNFRILRNGYEIIIRDVRRKKLSALSFYLGFAFGFAICGIIALVFL